MKGKGVGINRTETGIPGFDNLVSGGFPTNSSILVCGGPGTGKTIFCMEFLVNGATKFKEKSLYVTFEQKAEALKEQARQFGWDLSELEKKKMLTIMAIPFEKITEKTIADIKAFVKKEGIKRLVIDSLSTLVINAPIYVKPKELAIKDVMDGDVIFSPPVIGDYMTKKFIYGFIENLRYLDCTTLLISEASQSGEYLTRDTLSEFVCDGVVLISFESLGGAYSRSLIVKKMRSTKNDEDVHPMEMSSKGIIIHNIE